MAYQPILVLDVNETLLDVNALAPVFQKFFGDAAVLKEWFARVLLYSQTATLAGPYVDFATLGKHALKMTSRIRNVALDEADAASIVSGMRILPAHPDVLPALQQLRSAGFRLVTLTNSSPSAVAAQLKSAGLAEIFEASFSVDAVKRYKPAAEPYQYVASQLGLQTRDLLMIAAHPWDLIGATAAGCGTAFVERPGTAWFDLIPEPAIKGKDLAEVASRILKLYA